MTDPHKFRYLLPPGNNFKFVAKFKIWLMLSVLLMAASIGVLFVNKATRGEYMNWTIDFKGGTEIIFAFKDKATNAYTRVDPGKVRTALEKTEREGVEVSDIAWEATDASGNDVKVEGMIVRTQLFSALKPEQAEMARAAFVEAFKDREAKATWSGDRLSVRSKKHVTNAE